MRATAICALAVIAVASSARAQSDAAAASDAAPAVPANIEVPAGHTLVFKAHAVGTQNYICQLAPKGFAWRFLGPQATLFLTVGTEPGQQVTTHFLSANPTEAGTFRPTWQHSFDSSRVWARALASSTDSNYVAAGAIPWLLLKVTGAQAGPGGGSFLTQAAYIQRLNTAGGLTPATGCTQAGDAGVLALVPYEADYFFFTVAR